MHRIGIDIGTHTARAAWVGADQRPHLYTFANGQTELPALARQTMHGLLVGQAAAEALVGNTETTVAGCTRLMGRAGQIPTQLQERLAFPIREIGGEAYCNLLYAEVRASEIYGRVARALIDSIGVDPADVEVVLTIPATAEDRFRVQARTAVEQQGLHVRRLINQPAAALLGLAALQIAVGTRVAVVSCTGGSSEVSIAEQYEQGLQVLATSGDPLLGGDDLAWSVAKQLNQRFQRNGLDVFASSDSQAAAYGLRTAAEELLQRLRVATETTLTIDHGGGFGRDLVTIVRRSDIDQWLKADLKRIQELCKRVLTQAKLKPNQIESIVLIGDWAYMPSLQEAIAAAFARPVASLYSQEAEALAAYGAAVAAQHDTALIWDVTPYPLGINCYYGETELFSPIIKANTNIPTPIVGATGAYTESYTTRYPDQTTVRLDVLQYRGLLSANPYSAEKVIPSACERLGSWEFRGLKPKPGQQAAFTVTFAIDADGILQLSACETATGHTLHAKVERGLGS